MCYCTKLRLDRKKKLKEDSECDVTPPPNVEDNLGGSSVQWRRSAAQVRGTQTFSTECWSCVQWISIVQAWGNEIFLLNVIGIAYSYR